MRLDPGSGVPQSRRNATGTYIHVCGIRVWTKRLGVTILGVWSLRFGIWSLVFGVECLVFGLWSWCWGGC